MRFHSVSSHRIDRKPRTYLLAAGLFVTIVVISLFPHDSSSKERTIFQQFTQHIGKQIHHDKQAFARANNCLSWFYQATKVPPPSAQRISRNMMPASQLDRDCPRDYPGGMDDARDDFSKTQSVLSVSLTFYEFALVADRNDDATYGPTELQDLFRCLSLPYRQGEPTTKQVAALTDRFDNWYRSRNMDALMQGMSDLYGRGYRVTPSDRVELDRMMG